MINLLFFKKYLLLMQSWADEISVWSFVYVSDIHFLKPNKHNFVGI